ncbi:MAG: alpha/beta hydrolase [Bacteroidales bacterium]|nr:alpha/beta hydrolase [Bacteroidales bacterium]MDD3663992.1 alpha/beta hydrolase [Bacteroidales bacterium]
MKMRITISLIVLLFLNSCSNSNPISGYWTGSMEMNRKTVDISLVFKSGKASFTSNDLMLFEEPMADLKFKSNTISFSIDIETIFRFEGVVENGKIFGSVNIQDGPPNMKIDFNLVKKSDTLPTKVYSIEKLSVKNRDVNLSAEIYKPITNGLHPAIVLLHGSTTNLKKQYSFYADFFAKLGFEVLIFDKRGNGKSTGNYSTAGYDDLVEDAISCLMVFKNSKTVDTTKIGLWGFSQGAMLLPYIMTKTNIPTFIIAKSPEIYSVSEAGAFSDSLRIVNMGNSPANGHIVAESHRQVEKMIRNGSDYRVVENYINQNARKFNFMNQTGLYGNTSINKSEYDGYYWKGREKDFYPYWKSLDVKTLVLFGEDDEYINASRNENTLLGFENTNITIKKFPRANHAMKKTFNPAKYPDFDWPRITEGYLEYVEKWIENEINK